MEYSAIKMNTFESVLVRCITLEPAIQSEVNQKETYYYTHTHTHGNLQEWCWHAYLQNRNIEKDTDLWTQQGKKRVGQAEEHWNLWLCVRQTAKGGAVYHRELRELSLVLCDNQQRWGGVEGGRAVSQEGTYVYLWLILNCYRRNQHGKAIILQFQRTRVAE